MATDPGSGESYVAIPPELVKVIQELLHRPVIEEEESARVALLLRAAGVDVVSGALIVGVRVVRDLDQGPPPERGFGSI